MHMRGTWRRPGLTAIAAVGVAGLATGRVALAARLQPDHPRLRQQTSEVLFIEAHCGSNETAISWDKAGQPGPPGAAGPANGYTATFSGHEPFGRADTAVGKTITLANAGNYVVSG